MASEPSWRQGLGRVLCVMPGPELGNSSTEWTTAAAILAKGVIRRLFSWIEELLIPVRLKQS